MNFSSLFSGLGPDTSARNKGRETAPRFLKVWDVKEEGMPYPENILAGDICVVWPDLFDLAQPFWVKQNILIIIAEHPEINFVVVTPNLREALGYSLRISQKLGEFNYPDNFWVIGVVNSRESAWEANEIIEHIPAKVRGIAISGFPRGLMRVYEYDLVKNGIEELLLNPAVNWVLTVHENRSFVNGDFMTLAITYARFKKIPSMELPYFVGSWPEGFEPPAYLENHDQTEDDGLDLL